MTNTLPFPVQTPIARLKRPQFAIGTDPFVGLIDDQWLKSLTSISGAVSTSAQQVSSVSLLDQGASIAATDFPASLGPGNYRLQWFLACSRASGGFVGSAQVEIDFTNRGTPKSYVGLLMNGNTLQTWQRDFIFITIDENTPLTYAVAYASAGAPSFLYDLNLVLEKMP